MFFILYQNFLQHPVRGRRFVAAHNGSKRIIQRFDRSPGDDFRGVTISNWILTSQKDWSNARCGPMVKWINYVLGVYYSSNYDYSVEELVRGRWGILGVTVNYFVKNRNFLSDVKNSMKSKIDVIFRNAKIAIPKRNCNTFEIIFFQVTKLLQWNDGLLDNVQYEIIVLLGLVWFWKVFVKLC